MVCLIKEHWKKVPVSCKHCRDTVLELLQDGEISRNRYELWLKDGGIPQ